MGAVVGGDAGCHAFVPSIVTVKAVSNGASFLAVIRRRPSWSQRWAVSEKADQPRRAWP